MSARLSYAVITPARNERDNLERLAPCLASQTTRPGEWVIVDDGSTDSTDAFAERLAADHPWIRLTRLDAHDRREPLTDGRHRGRVVGAFRHGLESLTATPDVVVKLDADVTFDERYFTGLLEEFAADPALGLASGICLELCHGEWLPVHATGSHVRGASRAYRWKCLEDVSPLQERQGWDVIDSEEAMLKGWHARTLAELPFRHHRRVGERDRSRAQVWARQGALSHFLGYRPSYLIARAAFKSIRDPAAAALLAGYASAALRREPRYANQAVRDSIRRRQRLRRLPERAREALGRRAPAT